VSATIAPVIGPSIWRGADLRGRDDWIIGIEDETLSALAGALADARGRGETSGSLHIDR
jgi:hypothetical protein